MKIHQITFQSGGSPKGGGPFSGASFLSPGIFLLLLGLITLIAPQFVLAVIAAFFLAVGGLLLFLGYKFFQLKRRLEKDIEKMQTMSGEQSAQKHFQGIFTQQSRGFGGNPFSNNPFSDKPFPEGSAEISEYQIDGETVEILDSEEDDNDDTDRPSKIIIH